MREPHKPGFLDITDRPWTMALRLALIFLVSCAAWGVLVFGLIVAASVLQYG